MGIFRQPQSFDDVNRNPHKHSTAPVAGDQGPLSFAFLQEVHASAVFLSLVVAQGRAR
jgi:hypothetical protein